MLISAPLINYATFINFHYFGPKFSTNFCHSCHPRKRSSLSGWRSLSIGKTLRNSQSGQNSDPLYNFRESTINKCWKSWIEYWIIIKYLYFWATRRWIWTTSKRVGHWQRASWRWGNFDLKYGCYRGKGNKHRFANPLQLFQRN